MNTDDYTLGKRRWWLPTLSLAIWLTFFLTLSLSSWRLVLISADGESIGLRSKATWYWSAGRRFKSSRLKTVLPLPYY